MDTITISHLELWTHIGVPDEERAQEQRLLITITLHLDTKAAAKADDIEQTIDYFAVVEDVKQLAKQERKTIEKFADDIAQCILRQYKAKQVEVELKKFILPETEYVALSIVRP